MANELARGIPNTDFASTSIIQRCIGFLQRNWKSGFSDPSSGHKLGLLSVNLRESEETAIGCTRLGRRNAVVLRRLCEAIKATDHAVSGEGMTFEPFARQRPSFTD